MSTTSRRAFVKTCLSTAIGVPLVRDSTHAGQPVSVPRAAAGRGTVRERLWIFCCAANSDFPAIQRRSVMTPAEGAFFLGVPNIIMVQSSTTEAKYGRLEPPFAQYMYALRPLKRVVWSVVGSGGFSDPTETEEVLDLAKTQPSFVGVMLDDFFTGRRDGQRAKWTVDELAQFRRRLLAVNKDFKVFATYYYASQADFPLGDYLDLIDVVTLWCGPKDVVNLEANLKRAEASAPKCQKMLGCYVVDYAGKRGLPVELMKLQCETGLKWLRQSRIEGVIFLGNTTMDLGFESVEWARKWIEQIGDAPL
ncbi:MAG: hypothetical protein ACOX1P_15560 [Thermoguttaceae bacterium]